MTGGLASPGDRRGVPRPEAGRQRGLVTVELAFATLVVASVVTALAWAVGVIATLGACQVTANEVARQHARHDQAAVARATADAPAGARVDISTQQGSSVVVVTWTGRLGLLEWPVRAEARVIGEGSS